MISFAVARRILSSRKFYLAAPIGLSTHGLSLRPTCG